MHYLPNSPAGRERMLRSLGRASAKELFTQIPENIQLDRPLELPGPLSEVEILEFFRQASDQSCKDYASFLGAGAYSHYRPTVVDSLSSRGEFFTTYTPYQAEIAQGTLQAVFEFQSLICLLTGMDVANASLYDGSTALTEAVLMALRIRRGRRKVLVARSVHPEYRQVLDTYLCHLDAETVEIPFTKSGQVDLNVLEKELSHEGANEVAAVAIQSPNFFGVLEDYQPVAELTHKNKSLLIVTVTEPLSLALVKPPSEADIVCGEGQSFGIPVAFGGPYVGLLAARQQFVRQLPGRLVGQTVDTEGRRGYVITLATREQHIRREKATSNICTNQSLCALVATIYLSLLGRQGLRQLAELNLAKAEYTKRQLTGTQDVDPAFSGKTFNEFVVRLPQEPDDLLKNLQQEKILGGVPLGRFYPELKNSLLVCATETVGKTAIDRMAEVYQKTLAGSEALAPGKNTR
ncbi:MAG: aminomethyl-transferring glycine dehydrogenase subunit GcvPA [Acidobacteria bacterium]|nr:aminomethyl-transferring glycine dehydrogenase subunit GcvPA [Acidobacteriota bacterium]